MNCSFSDVPNKSNKGGSDGRGMWSAWGSRVMRRAIWWVNLNEREYSQDLGID